MAESATKTQELSDFPDAFSPVLVKELRQGLRTNLFVTAFILLQGFMILCLLMSQPGDNSGADGVFWFFIFVVFLIVQPLRGFSSLSSEYTFNTMDLIQLTNLNASRIAFGKWSALNAQSLLLLISVIPYLVMRYFYGSVDLVGDLKQLFGWAFCSGVLSAITVGCSAFKQLLPRLLLLIASITLFFMLFFNELISTSIEYLVLIYTGLIAACYYLFLGASKIAPQSENHATRKRILGFFGALGCGIFPIFGAEVGICMGCCAIITDLTLADALTESIPIFHGVLPPFKKTSLSRFSAGFLTPGWHTGFRFMFIGILPILFYDFINQLFNGGSLTLTENFDILVLLIGTLTFPLFIIHLFFKRTNLSHLTLYILIQACVGLLALLAHSASSNISSGADEIVYLLLPLPGVLLFGEMVDNLIRLSIGAAWLALICVVMLFSSRAPFQAMKEYFRSIDDKQSLPQ